MSTTPGQSTNPNYIAIGQALYQFQGENPRELSFEKGQEVHILSMPEDKGWWEGVVVQPSGVETRGFFSKNYVSITRTLESTSSSVAPSAGEVSKTEGVREGGGEEPVSGSGGSGIGGSGKPKHVLGPPQSGQYPWSKTFVCSCGARLPSPEVAKVHIKNFNK